jgi:hypothetical protein
MKKIIGAASVILLLSCCMLNAQEYFIKGKDTVYAKNMEYTVNMQGFITRLSYEDKSGKKTVIDGKKKLKDLKSLHYYSGTIERMPLKISKPDKYVRYGGRVADGKLVVLLYDDKHETLSWVRSPIDTRMDRFQTSTSGTRLFYLRMPDGTLHNLDKRSAMKKQIKPYLLQCENFKKQYKGNFSMEQNKIVEMIRLYNTACR